MGCDIYAAIEYREDGVWKALFMSEKWGYELRVSRDYALFGVLAGVCSDAYVPLSSGRGLPEDISEEAKQVVKGNHSDTYVYLSEILNYDWTQATYQCLPVSADTYSILPLLISTGRKPRCSHFDIKVSNEEMNRLLSSGEDISQVYTYIKWKENYAQETSNLWREILPHMLKLGAKYGSEYVRLVMSFDS